MEQSRYYNFNLPSREIDDEADIQPITENFEEIDRLLGEGFVAKNEVNQTYDPTDGSPISGLGVLEAITGAAPNILYNSSIFQNVNSVADELDKLEEDSNSKNDSITVANVRIDNVENELYEKTEWKTLLDITLTEKQGGTPTLRIAIEDVEALVNARQIRIAVSFPVAEAKNANAFWHSIVLADVNKESYNCCLLAGYNVKGGANATYFATADIKIFNFKQTSSFTRTFHSLVQLPNPYYTASANSNVNAKELTGGFNVEAIKASPPYLHITNPDGVTFEKGTRIFMEVQQ